MQESKFIHGYDMRYTDECLHEVYEKRFSTITLKEEPLKTFEINDGYVLPHKQGKKAEMYFGYGGVADEFGNVYEESIVKNKIYQGYSFDSKDVIVDDREVIYIGAFWMHWGHFILELVSRLYYFLNETDKSRPIVYVSKEPFYGNFLEFIKLLGIDPSRLIWVKDVTKFKKIIIPEVSVLPGHYYTKEYISIFDAVVKNIEPKGSEYEKVFYTTKNYPNRKNKEWGELEEIEDFFEQNGFKMVAPSEISLSEQIAILQGCKELVAISGTLPHNILFANKDIKVTILNKSHILNYSQILIDKATGIKSLYCDVHLSFFKSDIGYGPCLFCINDNLLRYAKDNNMSLVKSNINKYYKDFYKNYNAKYSRDYWILDRDKEYLKYKKYYLSKIKGNYFLKFYFANDLYVLMKNIYAFNLKVRKTVTAIKTALELSIIDLRL